MADVEDNVSVSGSSVYSALSDTPLAMPDFTLRVEQPPRITESMNFEFVQFKSAFVIKWENCVREYQRMEETVDKINSGDTPECETGPLLVIAKAAIKQVKREFAGFAKHVGNTAKVLSQHFMDKLYDIAAETLADLDVSDD